MEWQNAKVDRRSVNVLMCVRGQEASIQEARRETSKEEEEEEEKAKRRRKKREKHEWNWGKLEKSLTEILSKVCSQKAKPGNSVLVVFSSTRSAQTVSFHFIFLLLLLLPVSNSPVSSWISALIKNLRLWTARQIFSFSFPGLFAESTEWRAGTSIACLFSSQWRLSFAVRLGLSMCRRRQNKNYITSNKIK